MLLSQLSQNVDSLNALNAKTGSSDVWAIDSSQPSWVRIYKSNCGYDALIDTFDIDVILGLSVSSYFIGVELIDGEQRLAISVHKSLIEL